MNTFKKILGLVFYVASILATVMTLLIAYDVIRNLILCSGVCPAGGVVIPWWETFSRFVIFLVIAIVGFLIGKKLRK